ncbi:MAG TPA: phycobilisome rod-core linker polypeptide [Candidatus Caenarcaniphilales bacterium]
MPLPLLESALKTQNQRVEGYEVPNEDNPRIYRLTDATSESALIDLVWAAYRQIFSEHLILESYRQPFLESQLRNRAISMREFIRGLGKSGVYRELVAETNSNYRLVDITFKRFLGRATYNQDEQIAWSIVIATQGLHGFIDAVVDSDEYRQSFGDYIVPYQRRRMSGRPFNLVTPRYSDYWRNRQSGLDGRSYYQVRAYQSGDMDKQIIRQAIPPNFLAMAQGLLPTQVNYQRTTAQASSRAKNVELPDTTPRNRGPQPSLKPPEVALPYRYIPATPNGKS